MKIKEQTPAVLGIIKMDEKFLFVKRNRKNRFEPGKWGFIGEAIKFGEDVVDTLKRGIKEETNLDVELGDVFCRVNDFMHNGIYFLAKKFSGNLKLGGPELGRIDENNQYHLEWVHKETLQKLLLYPEEVKKKIIDYFSA